MKHYNRLQKEIIVLSVPLHPALVHIPLGLSFIMPALAVGLVWAIGKGQLKPRTWIVLVVALAVLLGAGLLALSTGHNEEDRVEGIVPEAAIATHEAYAEQFLWVTGITLGVSALVLVVRRRMPLRALTAATVVGTFLIGAAAVRVGHAGGQLVYVHNAPAAYRAPNQDAKVVNQKAPNVPPQAGAIDDGDDR